VQVGAIGDAIKVRNHISICAVLRIHDAHQCVKVGWPFLW
jgi:hypothetical protein